MNRRFEWILPAAAALCLVGHTLILSPRQPMWLDEVYTYYGVAHGSFGSLLASLPTNFNTTPPLYFVVVWALSKAIPLSTLSLRLYSTLGTAAAFCLVWAILRRHTGFLISSVATLAVFLTSELFLFHSAEARFYGAYIGIVAWAAYNCDRLCMEAKPSLRRLVWNGLSHALAISCTYVAGLYSFAILSSLLFRDRTLRVSRPAVYLSILAGWLPMLFYAPLIWLQRGARTWMPPPGIYAALDPVNFGLHPYVFFFVFAGLAAIAFLRKHCAGDRGSGAVGGLPPVANGLHVFLLGFGFLAVPYAMLAFAWAGLPLLLPRYALPSLIGAALLFGGISARLFGEPGDASSESKATAGGANRGLERLLRAAMIAALLAFPLWRAVSSARIAAAENKVGRYQADERGAIVAISDPYTYFPRYYYSGESHDIFYVVPNRESQERCARFNPRLNPILGMAFLAAHSSFRIISDDPPREWLEAELRKRGGFAITTEERTEYRKVLTVTRN